MCLNYLPIHPLLLKKNQRQKFIENKKKKKLRTSSANCSLKKKFNSIELFVFNFATCDKLIFQKYIIIFNFRDNWFQIFKKG
jgi:hypothetical protein